VIDPGTTIGAVHLTVSDLRRSVRFYHHHVRLNTWAGVGAPPPPPGAIGLRHFVVKLPDEAARDAVLGRLLAAGVVPEPVDGGLLIRDPAKNAILLGVTT
jgi:catechol 2,3-dioxygenase